MKLTSQKQSQPAKRPATLTGLRKRLADTQGETLVETLIAFLVIMLALAALAIAVVASARVNAAITPEETIFNFTNATPVESTVSITHEQGATSVADRVSAYQTTEEKGSYLYYTYDE